MPGIVSIRRYIYKYPNKIHAIFVFPTIPKSLSKKRLSFFKFLKKTPLAVLFYKLIETHVYCASLKLMRGITLKSIAKENSIYYKEFRSPKEHSMMEELKKLFPELILNFSPSIISKEVINMPSMGCLNFHGALLPYNRGVANYFWALINYNKPAGCTLHYMTPKLDEGDILIEKQFSIDPFETVHSYNYKCNAFAFELIEKAVEAIETNCILRKSQDPKKAVYRHFPSRKDLGAMHRKGFKLITLSDFIKSIREV